jgi:hypothetical protein
LYAAYFAAGTIGHCGNSGCHEKTQDRFKCGTDADTCFAGLVAARLVDLAHPETSTLGDSASSPLAWFGTGGDMPNDAADANDDAANAVVRWLQAGAPRSASQSDDDGGATADGGTRSNDAGRTADAGRTSDGGGPPPPPDAGSVAPTWTTVYTQYFASGTPGHCSASGCHSTTRSGFACGTSKTSCYNGLVRAGLIDTTDPASSELIDPNLTPLAWFGTGGSMPKGQATTNNAAAAAVQAWVLAGALNN